MENENNMCKWIGVEIQDLFVRDEKKNHSFATAALILTSIFN